MVWWWMGSLGSIRWLMRSQGIEGVGVVAGSCGLGALFGFSGKHQRLRRRPRWNTDQTDSTDNTDLRRIWENTQIRYPDCGTREGSQSVKIRFIRCIRVLFQCWSREDPSMFAQHQPETIKILAPPAPPPQLNSLLKHYGPITNQEILKSLPHKDTKI